MNQGHQRLAVAVYPNPAWVVKPCILASFGKNVLLHQPFTCKTEGLAPSINGRRVVTW